MKSLAPWITVLEALAVLGLLADQGSIYDSCISNSAYHSRIRTCFGQLLGSRSVTLAIMRTYEQIYTFYAEMWGSEVILPLSRDCPASAKPPL